MKRNFWLWTLVVSLSIFTSLMFTLASMSFTFMINNNQTWIGYLELWARIVVMLVFWIGWFIGLVCLNKSKNHLLRRLLTDYKAKIYRSISDNAYYKIKNNQAAELQNSFLKDAEIIRQKKYVSIFNIIYGLATVVFTAAAITFFSPWLLLITVGLTLLMFVVLQLLRKKMVRIQNKTSEISAKYGTGLMSVLKGLSIFFSYNKLDEYEQRNKALNQTYEEENLKLQNENLTVNTWIGVARDAATVGLVLLTAMLLSMNFFEAGVFLAIGNLGGSFMYRAGATIGDFMALKSTKEISQKYELIEQTQTSQMLFPNIKTIQFKNVGISYDDKVIIHNFDKTFHSHDKYLIEGPSGAGKSTLVKTLVGLNKISSGTLKVNNIKIDDSNIAGLRDQIAYIDQNIYLFDESLGYNISLSDEYDEAEIRKILHEVKLDSFLNRPLSENIGGDLEKISGGEKRRIGLARALYAKKDIFIVDESTSNLDPKNKDAIEKLILEQKDKTIFLISHDLTKQNYNLINEVVEINPYESQGDKHVEK